MIITSLPPARRMSEWTTETELLSVVADRLAELIQATAAGRGAKPRPITPSPRPAGARIDDGTAVQPTPLNAVPLPQDDGLELVADPPPRWQIYAMYESGTTTGPESLSIDIHDEVPVDAVIALLRALNRSTRNTSPEGGK
jgi:hypothetical protein